jgi:TonB-dependent receptor
MTKTLMRSAAWSPLVIALYAVAAAADPVTGTVVDGSGTRGLQGAEVTIVELGQTAVVGADGSFRFGDVPAGSYTVRAKFAGAVDDVRPIVVSDGGAVSIDFVLSPLPSELAGVTQVDDVLVIGQRSNFLSAISRQRSADTVQTVLTRDAIGQFPDQNVAEALRRAPGINVLNDQGEGRFVSVRGLDPNLNSSSINGNRVLATGGDNRSVALDVISSDLIESIEIKKTLTPDMDGDTIGGSIDITTTSSLDRRRNLFTVSLEGSYNDLNEKTSPKASFDFVYKVNDRFGIAGGVSYYNREFATDNIEMDGWEEDGGAVYAEDLEYRDYDVTRERYGATLSLDFRPNDSTQLYLRGLYSKFDDTELRTRLVFGFEEPTSTTANSATFDSADGRIRVERDLKDRREIQSVRTLSAGGRTDVGAWRFTYDLAWSEADQVEDGSIDPIVFRRDFEDPGELGVTIDYTDLRLPRYSIDFGQALFLDAGEYEFDELERTTEEDAKDKEFSARFDAAYDMALGDGSLELQFGAKARQRDKRQNFIIDIFDGNTDGLTLADVVGRQSYGLATIDPIPGLSEIRDLVRGGYGSFERNDLDSDFATNAESFSAEEDIYAGYGLLRFENASLRVIAGVRVEHTEGQLKGQRVDLVEEGAVVGGVALTEDTLFITPVQFDVSYTDWLPSVNVRYELAEDVIGRFGAFRSVVRPSFGQQAPRFLIEENDANERSGEFGNPDLDPYKAWNFDATLEWYFAPQAVLQGGVFYKTIEDYIVAAEFENGTFNGIAYDEAVIPINGEDATVFGVELSYGQALTFLPGPFDGLLVNFNYTYTDAEGDVLGRTIPLPASSEHTFNAVLGYEKGPLSLRVAGAYRSGYLDELGGDAESDRYVDSHFQVDLSGKYRLTPNVQLFGEVVNLNDATYTAYQRGPGRDRLLQYEEYSWTAKFGVRLNF